MYCRIDATLTSQQASWLCYALLPGNWRVVDYDCGFGFLRITPSPIHSEIETLQQIKKGSVIGLADWAGQRGPANFVLSLEPMEESDRIHFTFVLMRHRYDGPWAMAKSVARAIADLDLDCQLTFPSVNGLVKVQLASDDLSRLVKTTDKLCDGGSDLWHRPRTELQQQWSGLIERGRFDPNFGWGVLLWQTRLLLACDETRPSYNPMDEDVRTRAREIVAYWTQILGYNSTV